MSIFQENRAKIIASSYKHWNIHGKKVLDVGCGNGIVSDVLRKNLNIDLYGTDIIDYRKRELPFKQMKVANRLPFDDSSFDYVMFNDALHHIEDIELLIIEGGRVARNILIFEDQKNFLLQFIDVVFNYFYSPKIPFPVNHKTLEEWCLLFRRIGFDYEIGKIYYPSWYPFRHMAFRLVR